MRRKRLQVFVSSTYEDLKVERQAAVQAILKAGHIPAGMELFSAGDQEQMETIRKWIDQSDVFMLILGHRYGSIEPKSGKSYIHCEFDYAVSMGKPFFSIVAKDDEEFRQKRANSCGIKILESEEPKKYKQFRSTVTGKMVAFWEDIKDIEKEILHSLNEFAQRDNLIGWVRADEVGYPNSSFECSGLNYQELKSALNNSILHEQIKSKFDSNDMAEIDYEEKCRETARDVFGSNKVTALHIFWFEKDRLFGDQRLRNGSFRYNFLFFLQRKGLILVKKTQKGIAFNEAERRIKSMIASLGPNCGVELTNSGIHFLNILEKEILENLSEP